VPCPFPGATLVAASVAARPRLKRFRMDGTPTATVTINKRPHSAHPFSIPVPAPRTPET
jgi:hypothetical protein